MEFDFGRCLRNNPRAFIGPGDLVSSSTNSSAIAFSRSIVGVDDALLFPKDKDSTDNVLSVDAPLAAPLTPGVTSENESSDAGECGKYTVGVAEARPNVFPVIRDFADSKPFVPGALLVTPREVTDPGVLNPAPADIQISDELEDGDSGVTDLCLRCA